jgi:hypothetical protein
MPFFRPLSVSPDVIPTEENLVPISEDMDIIDIAALPGAINHMEPDTIDSPISVSDLSDFLEFAPDEPVNPLLERREQLGRMAQQRFGKTVYSDNNDDDSSLEEDDSVDHGDFAGQVNNAEDRDDAPEEDDSLGKDDAPYKDDSFDVDRKPKRTRKKTVAKKDPSQPKKERKKQTGFGTDPWPDWPKPTPKECEEVNRLLTISEGESKRPDKLVVDITITGCGEVPDVLDAVSGSYPDFESYD